MEANIITVYIDNKPYRFRVDVDYKDDKTTYNVAAADEQTREPDFIPDELHYDEDGALTVKESLRTVEQEQIARLVWQEIIDKMKP
jgi:hypothetical protein